MMPWNRTSLRSRLTWRMAGLQAAVLLGVAAVAAIPVTRLLADKQGLDVTVYEEIALDVTVGPGGNLVAPADGVFDQLVGKYPRLWFYATDADGNVARHGTLTPAVLGLVDELPRLTSGYLPDIGPDDAREAVVRRVDAPGGPLWIIGGGGPEIRLRTALMAFSNPVFIGLLVSLTAASFLFIPMLVRRQLRGVARIAAEADTIDVEQRGVRLSTSHVPDELHSLVGAVNAALQRLDDGI